MLKATAKFCFWGFAKMKAITQKEQKKLLSHLVITVYANHTKSGILQNCKRCKIIWIFAPKFINATMWKFKKRIKIYFSVKFEMRHNKCFFKHCESEFNISFQVLSNLKKRLKKIGSGHDHLKKGQKEKVHFCQKVLTFQGGETCCQNESADNTSIGSKVRNPLENTTNGV